MKFFQLLFVYLSLSFFLTISCDDNPPTESKEANPKITKDSTPKSTNAIAPAVKETMTIDTTSVDTMKQVQKEARPTRAPAKIEFEETSHSYDTIKQGDIVEYSFKFKNIGQRPLSIKDVKGSCGCTIGSYPFLDIAPKEESVIKARFDSKGKVGPQFTTITVYSNANEKGDVLSLEGVVVE